MGSNHKIAILLSWLVYLGGILENSFGLNPHNTLTGINLDLSHLVELSENLYINP